MGARARGSTSSSIGDSAELEANLTLNDRLKETRHLSSYLVELKKAYVEEMQDILEGHLLSMRNLLSAQAALVHGCTDGVHISSMAELEEGRRVAIEAHNNSSVI